MAAVVIGVLLAVGTVVALTAFSFDSYGEIILLSLLVVPVAVGVGIVLCGKVRDRAENPGTARLAHLAVIAGRAYFCAYVAIVLAAVVGSGDEGGG